VRSTGLLALTETVTTVICQFLAGSHSIWQSYRQQSHDKEHSDGKFVLAGKMDFKRSLQSHSHRFWRQKLGVCFLLEVAETEDKTEQHLTDAEDDRNLHLERVEPRYLVVSQLPHLYGKSHHVTPVQVAVY